ncbi:hypothetical protein CO670_01955 [Rhizobium sp. J15]|uniref:hypothetical protein n=1 Tax=Rhizobium sp. J15 TaxID=2035450 RepID=UPI000BE9ACD3|nr:hypothetical protein [Rhizobium sp. J15]PDT18875.1 hypothetical protein CO670_01955 [Rhizobium sp. J15]
MKPSLLVVGLPLIAAACASTPPDVVAFGAVQQEHTVPPARYRSPISGYVARDPVDPKSWRQQNDRQSSADGDAS